MKFFDYIFFRSYRFYKRHNDLPMHSSAAIITAEILVLTSCLWGNLLYLLLPNMPKHAYIISWTYYFCVYFKYRKKKKILFQEFKTCKYNKSIPDWVCIWGTLIPSIILGVIMLACTSAYITRHHLSGILWPYIEPYLGRFIY